MNCIWVGNLAITCIALHVCFVNIGIGAYIGAMSHLYDIVRPMNIYVIYVSAIIIMWELYAFPATTSKPVNTSTPARNLFFPISFSWERVHYAHVDITQFNNHFYLLQQGMNDLMFHCTIYTWKWWLHLPDQGQDFVLKCWRDSKYKHTVACCGLYLFYYLYITFYTNTSWPVFKILLSLHIIFMLSIF